MNKNRIKMIFDIIICILFILLMDTITTGIFLHELLGILLFGLFILHKAINRKWIKNVTLGLFKKEINTKTRVMYVVDVLLLISVTVLTLSGIFISESLFTFIQVGNIDYLRVIHKFSAYFSLVIVAVHIGLHWPMIMAMVKKILKLRQKNFARNVVLRVLAVAIVVWGVKCSIDKNLAGELLAPFGTTKNTYEALPGTGADTGEAVASDIPSFDTQAAQMSYTLGSTDSGLEITTSTKNTADTSALSATPVAGDSGSQSLEDYLSKLYCTGCGRHCSLLAPQCSTGVRQAAIAEQEYYNNNSSDENTADGNGGTTDENTTDGTTDESGGTDENGTQFEEPQGREGHNGNGWRNDGAAAGQQETDQAQIDGFADANAGGEISGIPGTFGDFVPILGLFIVATHYAAKGFKRKRHSEKPEHLVLPEDSKDMLQ